MAPPPPPPPLLPSDMASHVLVLPFPSQGHLNPLLLFSAHLALRGSAVTFVRTEASSFQPVLQSRIESAISSSFQNRDLPIRFVTIPDGMDDSNALAEGTSPKSLFDVFDTLVKQQGMIEELIHRSQCTASPISCIISDSFLTWTLDIGKKHGIPRVCFWTSSATTLYMTWLVAMGKYKLGDPWPDTLEPPVYSGLSSLHHDIISSFSCNSSPERVQFHVRRCRDMEDNACIIVNSFHELEGPILGAIPLDVPIKFVGPLRPLIPLADNDRSTQASLNTEEDECLRWLDKQASSSVAYISFGSIVSLKPAELSHLALGIEASGQPFLWVILSNNNRENTQLLPEGFGERTQKRGLIISWAPQLRVLSHPAVGVFLTHCGWNSTIESISMGVPMLCWPVFGDQQLNSTLIVKQWKVGFEFGTKEGVVEKEEVERVVRMAMEDGEASREVRKRALAMKNAALQAAMEASSSHTTFGDSILI